MRTWSPLIEYVSLYWFKWRHVIVIGFVVHRCTSKVPNLIEAQLFI